MSQLTHGGAVPAVDSAHAPAKTPRDRLIRLTVQTDLCPQVVMRVLGLLAQHWLIPLSIAAHRGDDGLSLTVELDCEFMPDERIDTILAKVQTIVMVRAAQVDRA